MIDRKVNPRDSRPDLSRGDTVVVGEPGLPEWSGTVLSVKPGERVWYVEVRQDDGSMTFGVPAGYVRRAR